MPEDVVLLHGFSGTHRAWDGVVAHLSPERYRPLGLDLPGHGSFADAERPITFAGCVDHVLTRAPACFALCGYSLGGRVALHVALAAPERVTRLVLVSTTAGIEDAAERAERNAADHRLARELERVEALHLDQKGRGRALRAAWSASTARVVAYMDVDLSTDLDALLPLVAPLLSGHSDVAIGTRLASNARVVRGPKRELISRGYNLLLKTTLRAGFSDAQCGFKALRTDVAHSVLPLVEDQGWFFDTELLVLAQRQGMRIQEVAVDWIDDPDSRVDIVRTAITDLRGVARLRLATPVARFVLIGILSTLA